MFPVLLAVWALAAYPPAWGADGSNMRILVTVMDSVASLDMPLDTHEWFFEPWGLQSTPEYGTFHGRDCLRMVLSGTGNLAFLRTNEFFSPENWGSVSTVRMDVYIEGTNNKNIELEIQRLDGSVALKTNATGLVPGSWVTASWSVSGLPNDIAKLFLIPGTLAPGETIHFSNLRINRGGGDEPWDTFAEDTSNWTGSEDFVPWKSGPRNEPISHNQTHGASAGALYIPWDAAKSTSDSAKMEAQDLLGMSLGGYPKYRAWVRSDRTDAPVFLAFWDGTNFVSTSYQSVSTANVWQQLTWDQPSGVNWSALQTWMVLVRTVAGGTGNVYVDDIEFGY